LLGEHFQLRAQLIGFAKRFAPDRRQTGLVETTFAKKKKKNWPALEERCICRRKTYSMPGMGQGVAYLSGHGTTRIRPLRVRPRGKCQVYAMSWGHDLTGGHGWSPICIRATFAHTRRARSRKLLIASGAATGGLAIGRKTDRGPVTGHFAFFRRHPPPPATPTRPNPSLVQTDAVASFLAFVARGIAGPQQQR